MDAPSNAPKIKFRDQGIIQLCEVRLSYPHLFEPWNLEEGKPKKYGAKFIMAVATHREDIKALHGAITALSMETYKSKLPADRYCLRDGNLTENPESKNAWNVSASEATKPKVAGTDGQPLPDGSPLIYAGCTVNAYIKLWAHSGPTVQRFGKRVNANLLGVQFVRHGERIGVERPDVSPMFESLGAGEVVEMETDDFQL
jgi:hypothetical protein